MRTMLRHIAAVIKNDGTKTMNTATAEGRLMISWAGCEAKGNSGELVGWTEAASPCVEGPLRACLGVSSSFFHDDTRDHEADTLVIRP